MRSMPDRGRRRRRNTRRRTARSPCACRPCRGRPSSSRGSGGCEPGQLEALRGRYAWSSGRSTPYSSAASAISGLIVEPGGYTPRSARSNSGLSRSSCSAEILAHGEAAREAVRVEGRRAHEREHVAVVRVDGDHGGALAGERLLGDAARAVDASRIRSLPAIGSWRCEVGASDSPTRSTERPCAFTSTAGSRCRRAARPRRRARCRACRSASCRRTSRRRCVAWSSSLIAPT